MSDFKTFKFNSFDNYAIHYKKWSSSKPTQKSVIILHRGHEHSGRVSHVVDELRAMGLDHNYYAWDARGHGLNEGARGFADNFGVLLYDLELFVKDLEKNHGLDLTQTVIIAQSVGAVIASAWVHDYAPKIRGLVLASPAFSVKLYVPLAVPSLKLGLLFKPVFFVNSYVKSRFLTHDVERQKSYDSDPLVTKAIAVNILVQLYETANRVVKNAAVIKNPCLLLISEKDFVVRKEPQVEFFNNLGSETKKMVDLKGFFHDTLGEKDRGIAFQEIKKFIDDLHSKPLWSSNELSNDKRGPSFEEFEALKRPSSFPLNFTEYISKLSLKVGSKLSKGLSIGQEHGYDSGVMLDHVYKNEPQGVSFIGRIIDRLYLDAIGWRGIRIRGASLSSLLAKSMEAQRQKYSSVKILDVASGPGRYVLNSLKRVMHPRDRAVLQDFMPVNVETAKRLIEEFNMQTVVTARQGDCFDRSTYESLDFDPNIAITSGIFELFSDNGQVLGALSAIHDKLAPEGLILYTNQPWHPQLRFIAKVLTSHKGQSAWVMRRRSQAEMDQLVETAGFKKIQQLSDQWGIFTVSVAVKKSKH